MPAKKFGPLIHNTLTLPSGGDRFAVLADYAAYIACQEDVDRLYRDRTAWARKAVLNVANSGRFSSDRTIHEYAESVWGLRAGR